MNKRKVFLGLLLAGTCLIALDQGLLHTLLADGELLGNELAPFAPPLFGARQRALLDEYEERLAHRREEFDRLTQFDAELGWCPRPEQVLGLAAFDWSGSRIAEAALPRERPAGSRRIALVGCSFTHGSEVTGEETWAAQLEARLPQTRFANLGVGGYGVDQALLRYRRDGAPLAPDEVWLGFFPGAALRVTSRFPPLFGRWRSRTLNFKPCFTLDDGEALRLLSSPARTPEDIPRLLRDPGAFLAALGGDDPWLRRARPAYLPLGTHWSHHFALGRIALTLYERRGRATSALLADRDSVVSRLNRALVLALARDVQQSGARFRVLVLPGGHDLVELERSGRGHWQDFVDALRESGLDVLDLSAALLRAGVGQDERYWMPEGHYTPLTNGLVAAAIEEAWFRP